MSHGLNKSALLLAARFKSTWPGIPAFLEMLTEVDPGEAPAYLGSSEMRARLQNLNKVELRLLADLIDEIRVQGEARHFYREAAYWDLVADRVRDELATRG